MQEVLEKYYEFFLKNNFTDKDNEDEIEIFKRFIINFDELKNEDFVFDPSKDKRYNYLHRYKPLKYELDLFFTFFDDISNYGGSRRKDLFSSSNIMNEEDEKRLKKDFETRFGDHVSFKWFKPSPNIVKKNNFAYSIKHTKNIYCKAYLSIKPEKYINVMIKLQEFIDKLYENHPDEEIGEIKFRVVPANDAIVLRLASRKHYEEFINFLDNNPEIQESYDTPNPFIPRDDHGVALLPDKNSTYNKFITTLLLHYMFKCKEENKNVSVEDLCSFIKAYDCTTMRFTMMCGKNMADTFKNILIGKLLSKPDSELLSFMSEEKVKQDDELNVMMDGSKNNNDISHGNHI